MKKILSIQFVLFFLAINAQAIDTVQISSPKRCMFGDMDLMVHDHMARSESRIILSVLNLKTSEEKTFNVLENFFSKPDAGNVKQEVKNFLSNGEQVAIANAIDADGKYLISICNDQDGKASCLDKKVEDIGQQIAKYQKPEGKPVPTDRIYFAQLLEKKGAEIDFSKDAITKENIASVHTDSQLEKEWLNKASIISSSPLAVTANTLNIDLPLFSPKKCAIQ